MESVDGTRTSSSSPSPSPPPARWPWILVGWVVTILTLVVLDDLVFGPVFWALSRRQGAATAAVAAFVVYLVAQLYIVHQGTSSEPGRLARFFLRRLGLERRNATVGRNEDEIRRRVLGGGSAVLVSPVIGGVIPSMLLWHRGFERRFVRRLSVVTSTIYAAEFALLHGWIPGGVAR